MSSKFTLDDEFGTPSKIPVRPTPRKTGGLVVGGLCESFSPDCGTLPSLTLHSPPPGSPYSPAAVCVTGLCESVKGPRLLLLLCGVNTSLIEC